MDRTYMKTSKRHSTRILMVSNKPLSNPFITILATEIATKDFLVVSSIESFLEGKETYDIIQIHWPELIFTSTNKHTPSEDFGQQLSDILLAWKEKGTRIVFTRHDETTHYVQSQNVRTYLYGIIESAADAIVHLGQYSLQQMMEKEKDAHRIHILIPHHVYDTIYPISISQAEARAALSIRLEKKVILTFGSFRDMEEHLLVKNVFESLDIPDKYLLAPSWLNGWNQYVNPGITIEGEGFIGYGIVDKDMLPYCFAAADVVFIQRIRNLNSGNLPMGFFFNKTVVGPAIGNMTEYLDNRHNFSFDPFDSSSVLKALERGIERSKYPQANEAYARKHWNTTAVCEAYRKLYQQLINR
jgi:hypothetical protein